MSLIPDSHLDLLDRPLFAHLATIRPDGVPQVNPMWFHWDGEFVRFTNTTTRYKYRNVTTNPVVAFSVNDPDQPYRYLEIRGTVERIDKDADAEFFLELAKRYSLPMDGPPEDAPDRVIYVIRPIAVSRQ
ncbi:PPOX class F420-dependent oxidoreductase [Actinokineospora diospyrosa]|uniref:PPOX class probable F420-dependent enzyme n=1 Tax=Actinokineospora diospyrosa TaxID=103728 RepID=A0ABT1IIY0_9PSEU|nr:PPOX class F420-dependent oxidoreductase [Actinokineospora diospyrosa]MCP2272600.1 PPOX class probable F420-dependent enzyme [Actinokineospora diospyrosa]